MSKNHYTKEDVSTTTNPAIEKFEKMFKEIDIQPTEKNDKDSKEKHSDWIVSGTGSNSIVIKGFV